MTRRGAKAVSLPPVDATPEEIAQTLFAPRPTPKVRAARGGKKPKTGKANKNSEAK